MTKRQGTRGRAPVLLALVALGALAGCEEQRRTETLRPSYERPKAKAAPPDVACTARLASTELRFQDATPAILTTTDKGLVHIADFSVLGGPFEPPIAVELPVGTFPVRLIVDRSGVARCVRALVAEGTTAAEVRVGEVVVDSGSLVFADGARVTGWLQRQPGDVFVGFEGPAGEMESLAQTVSGSLPTERVLPTYYRATRPFAAGDLDIVKRAIQAGKSHARAQVEPRPAAWPFVAALGDGKIAVSNDAGPGSAVLVDVPPGDGAYVVTVSKDDHGNVLAVTASLER